MTRPRIPRTLLGPVVDYFKPQRVILFGSRARDEANRDSDIDLLVIVDDDTPPEKLTWKADARRNSLLPAPPPTCSRCAPRPSNSIATSSARSRPRPMATVHRLWLTKGIAIGEGGRPPGSLGSGGTMARCRRCRSRHGGNLHRRGAGAERKRRLHRQQAIDKLLKGFLVLAGKRFRKTHSLAQLGAAAQQSFPDLENLVTAARNWSDWAFEYRYPSTSGRTKPLPEEGELQRALATFDVLTARLRAARPQD
jgi:HEPN domain-containing protein